MPKRTTILPGGLCRKIKILYFCYWVGWLVSSGRSKQNFQFGPITKRLIWDRRAKIGFFGQKPRFWAQKKHTLLNSNHVLATTGKSCSKKKVALAQIIITQNDISHLDYLGKGTFFLWTTFSGCGQNMVNLKKWVFFGPKISVFGPKIRFLPYDPNFGQWPIFSPRHDG